MSALSLTLKPHPSPTPPDQVAALIEDPGFGKVFSDHMVTVRWTAEKGWTDAEVRARAPLQLDPAAVVLHYAQEVFEGMKAYRQADAGLALFRPFENARRFAASASRLAMPQLPEAAFVEAVEALVGIDADWTPDAPGSLYLRPFMFATEALLGVRPASEYLFCVIASPVGDYFKGGGKPVTVWAPAVFTRAAPGGTGAAKCGGNYAASLFAQAEAARHGCDQVVFLDAAEHRWVEELGGMNIFFVMGDGTLITPPLTGTILPGITRASLIELARDQGLSVEERPYALEEWRSDATSGRLSEVFACGTGAVITAIGEVRSEAGAFCAALQSNGPVTNTLRAHLLGLQRGEIEDRRGWIHKVRRAPMLGVRVCAW